MKQQALPLLDLLSCCCHEASYLLFSSCFISLAVELKVVHLARKKENSLLCPLAFLTKPCAHFPGTASGL